ncbi:arginine ABC transporter ATP-binding protein ArtP [Shewanella sp. NFH-SH190041]|uniref:arginine ABC transporter ATP-binding protein ArtP n=1 Tax=Shewanella sp. NFH-SH190041 TaxID=2950245 RepID=UPI0021C46BB5|nr:arginine ABC transporter ATP-binding protein ArtP [Shewanella sp. NFH-SH190041]BDM64865.1 arginine ABC transporter ATP-binding protein ArtP [Shewanella sp. NFH-SH190041]
MSEINLKGINCFYGISQSLFDIDFCAPAGAVIALLGASGAGKSSLLRVFNLMEMPADGEYTVGEHQFNFSQKPAADAVRRLRTDVGMVFQQYHLWPHFTVLENLIEAPCKVLKVDRQQAEQKAMELILRLRLHDLEHRYPVQLSGGQQQRVAIARALMMSPKVMLYDEPTAALDPQMTAQFAEIVRELSATGITQIIVTHEVALARKVADTVVFLEAGRVVEQGDVSILSQPKTADLSNYLFQ